MVLKKAKVGLITTSGVTVCRGQTVTILHCEGCGEFYIIGGRARRYCDEDCRNRSKARAWRKRKAA